MKRNILFTLSLFALVLSLSFSTNAQRRQLKWANVMAPGTPNMIAGWDSNGDPAEVDVSSGSVGVTSVFGRTGIVTAQSNDYTFAQIGSKPTTLSGYGITDSVVVTSTSYANPSWLTSLSWSKVTSTPTTLSGYGITDPVVVTSTSYANPSWLTSLPWSKVTSTPTTLSGYGITDPIVLTSGSYANPSWVTSLTWSKVTTTPTTLSGYGITDPVVVTSGSYANPSWITSLAWSKVSATPTTIAGYGITDLAGGTYTPTTSTLSTQVSSVTFNQCIYSRIGSSVDVSGSFSITYTTSPSESSFRISLPIVSNLTSQFDVTGFGLIGLGADLTEPQCSISGIAATDEAQFYFPDNGGTSTTKTYFFHLKYVVR